DQARPNHAQGRDHRPLPLGPRRQGRRDRGSHARDDRMTGRLTDRSAACAAENRPALVTYIMAGDPDYDTALATFKALPGAGADVIELGMPFSDPMADGPAIQAAGQRALKGGQTLNKTLAMVAEFRKADTTTPVVLMGYFNPIYIHGVDKFLADALAVGLDGMIIV